MTRDVLSEPVMVVVRGTPVGQPRPRFDSRNRRSYTPDRSGKLSAWKSRVAGAVLSLPAAQKAALLRWQDEGFAMEIAIQVRMPKPPTTRLQRPTSKPDWDNVAKGIQDALEDARAIGNDSRVVKASVYKRWCREGEAPGATVVLAPFQGE